MAVVLHFYTTEDKKIPGWEYEGVTCHMYPSLQDGALALHRWKYLDQNNHYYTTKYTQDNPLPGWIYERIEGYVFIKPRADLIPIYHWWNPGTGDNFYTADYNGELAPGSGYEKHEEDMFYAFANAKPNTVPFHRWVGGTQQYCVIIYGAVQPEGRPVILKKTIEAGPPDEAKAIAQAVYDDYYAQAMASLGDLQIPASLPEGLDVSVGGC